MAEASSAAAEKQGAARMATLKKPHFGTPTPVRIPLEEATLDGEITISTDATGLIVFVHGSGSSRFSPRNLYVAQELNKRGLATLLLDLLTEEEQQVDSETMQYRFDIPLLARRSVQVVNWIREQASLRELPIGLFGASTGAAAALITAASLQDQVAALVSRGGRPDLAKDALPLVQAPTLFLVGGADKVVLDLNHQAMDQMNCIKSLQVISGATHLFEEPGALEQVAHSAASWFVKYLQSATPARHQVAS